MSLAFRYRLRNFLVPQIFQDRHGLTLGDVMSQEDDNELMRQINFQADVAERAKPTNQNISAIAAMLAEHFDHRDEGDIKEQIKQVWRSRELFWDE
ncbi:hypothetical protein CO661_12005 [Sinorhizobium fredii]|uniref:Uncharacterized protein n=1 Tax=Rhizobium fredii TaxID=380 RepID=A0A2A6LZ95_RHIFR|nr:hypothetical protein [Sinorhizobium fredii]PDT47459.1 hypothetical protein CO661_12005 [Sinorhizobium fredii]